MSEKMMESCDCSHGGCCQPGNCCDMCGGMNCYCKPAKIFIAGLVVAAWGLNYIDSKTAGLLLAAGLIVKAVFIFMRRSM